MDARREPSRRQNRVAEEVAHMAGEFLARESNHTSLMTVTHADTSPDIKNITIFVSILPESMEAQGLDFLKRNRTEFRQYLKENARFKFLPTVDFEIDYGEKNRQRVSELTNKPPVL